MKDKCYPNTEIKILKDMISKEAQFFYIPQDEIEESHPCTSEDPLVFLCYDAAVALVSERHAKYELTDLVGHLLLKIARMEEDANAAYLRS